MTPSDHGNVYKPPAIVMVLCGVGGVLMSNDDPSKVELLIAVRTIFARRTAPSMFNSPAPWSNVLKFASCCAEYIISDLTRLGVSVGFARSEERRVGKEGRSR